MAWYDFIPTVQKQARDMASTVSKGYDWLTETRMRQDKERETQERARAELMQEQARCESRARLRGSQRQQTARDKQARLDAIQQASTELREQLPEGTLIDQKMIDAQMGSGGTWAKRATEMGYEKELFERNVKQIEADQKQKDKILAKLIKDEIITPDTPSDRREALINYNMLDYYREQAIAKGNTALANELTSRQAAWQEDIEQARIGELPWYKPERIKAEIKERLPKDIEEFKAGFATLAQGEGIEGGMIGIPEEQIPRPAPQEFPAPTISLEQYNQSYFKMRGWAIEIDRATATPREIVDFDQHTRLANEAYKNKFGKDALLNSQFGRGSSMFFAPARAIRPEVEFKDISAAEHIFGVGQAALWVVGPIGGAIGGVTGSLVATGARVTAAAAFTAHTAMNWDNMTTEQKIISVGFDAVLIFSAIKMSQGTMTDIQVSKNFDKSPLYQSMPVRAKADPVLMKKFRSWAVDANRAMKNWRTGAIDKAAENRAGKMYEKIKAELIKKGFTKGKLASGAEAWTPQAQAAFGIQTTGNQGVNAVAQEINKVRPVTPAQPTPPIRPPVTPAPTTPVAKTKPEMEALIKQGYKFDLETKTWGKPIAPTEAVKPTEQPLKAEIKQQWQMTKEEFRDSQYELAKSATIDSVSAQKMQKNKNWLEEGIEFRLNILTRAHRTYISKMLKEGKPVPANVLAEYPDMEAVGAKPLEVKEPTEAITGMETGTPTEWTTTGMANWSTDIDAIMEAQAVPEVMATNAQKAKIHTLAAEKKWLDKKGRPKQQYRRLAKSMTGKTSSAKMTQDEASKFIEALSKLPEVTLRGKPPTLPIKTKLVPEGLLKRPFSEPSYPAEWFTPQNRYAVKLGVGELTRPIEDAKRGMDVEYYKVKHQIEQLIDQVNKLGGTSVAEKVQAKLKNKPTAAVKQMRDWLDTYEEAPAELSPQQVNVFNWFRDLNRDLLGRENQVRARLGREPIEYRQAYVRHIADTVAQSILQGNQPYPTELGDWEKINISKKLNNPMEYQRTLEEDLYELFTRDLGFATKSMVRTALREVYLSEPLNNLNEQIGTMSKEMPNYKGLTQAELESVQDIQKMPLSTRSWLIDYINENIKDYPSGFDIKVNRWLTQSGLKGVFDEALKPFGRSLGQMPLTAAGRKIGEAVIFAVLPGRPKILIRNLFQTLQNTGLYGIKATMIGIFPADPSVKELMDKSLFLKNYTGLEEMPTGTLGKIEKIVSKPYRWTAVGNVQRGMRAAAYDIEELFTKKEYAWTNWASPQRTYTEPEGFLYPDEKARKLREMEFGGGQSAQYDYSKMGMPGIFRHKVLTPLTRLQSWHMNYFWSYWPEMMTRAFKGHVGYDTNLKLPWSKRINALKYLVVGGFILTKMGYKRSFMLGVLPHYMSPAAQFALGLYNYLTADSDWTRLKGEQAMKYSITAIIPGSLAWRDWSAVWKGDKPLESLFLYGTEEGEAEKTPSYLVK